MKAVSGIDKPEILAVNAGADVLLRPGDPQIILASLAGAVEDKRIDIDTVDNAVKRILRIKLERGILDKENKPPDFSEIGGEKNGGIAAEVITSG